ncbi:four-carbon acid sugar kinase family protein [Thiohalocapsa sp.]|uniref:four-carbon acid sugar kinase family protein n=1 Tax=Thiohalocapsa sp. TaxID=2497641 RepID=UPI0025CE6142|nr:four-carbon acid sugar kinase family protein [Thiohalocapsa sp.]
MTVPTVKIVAIDDDPTGSQTVHGCLLLTRWDVRTLTRALKDDSPLFFVLSNTRGMDADRAATVTRDICVNLRLALADLEAAGAPVQPVILSRSDSTLRGHYPVETDVIAAELGPFDAHFLVPAFFEGGRITRGGTHYLIVDEQPVPVHETEFARDSVFGFSTAFLPDYVEEKTGGRIPAGAVEHFGLDDLRGDQDRLTARLLNLAGNACCAVDAEQQSDLDAFAAAVLAATAQGKRFLFRSAASLLTSLAALPPQPVAPADMGQFTRSVRPGVVLMGSHVGKSTRQLEHLTGNTDIAALEVDLGRLEAPDALIADLIAGVEAAAAEGRGAVLYTSRGEHRFPSKAERLVFGEQVSDLLVRIVQSLPPDIGFLISKGGITSNDTLSKGLALTTARVLGQVRAGCSVVRCPADHPRFPDLPVVIFPGNVGGDESLTEVYRIMSTAPQ